MKRLIMTTAAVLLLTHTNRVDSGNARDKYGATGELRKKARLTLFAPAPQLVREIWAHMRECATCIENRRVLDEWHKTHPRLSRARTADVADIGEPYGGAIHIGDQVQQDQERNQFQRDATYQPQFLAHEIGLRLLLL